MQGVIAAVPTPIDETGAPLKDLFVDHCAWLLGNGCDGLNILGSTGEANSFGLNDRKTIMRWAADHVDRERLMVGTGTPALADTVALTCHADELGYAAALVLPPFYYKPVSDDGLFHWYARLHQELGDRAIAIYFYNFPQMTGLTIPVQVMSRLHTAWPDRFAGIKDSSGDLDYCRTLASALPGFLVFPSSEVTLGEAHVSGFAGCISATTNQTSALSAALWHNRAAPDANIVSRVSDLRATISKQDLIPSIKFLVAARTGARAWETLLPPFVALDATRKQDLSRLQHHLSGG